MRQEHGLHLPSGTKLLGVSSDASPGPSPASQANTDVDSYFDLRADGSHSSPRSVRSAPSSVAMYGTPIVTTAALTALQYLPMPVLVLNSLKSVVVANEAMGRLLGIDPSELANEMGPVATITDVLRGRAISQLGIEILAHGSPILVCWEDFLDSVATGGARSTPQEDKAFSKSRRQGGAPRSGESTPTGHQELDGIATEDHALDGSAATPNILAAGTVIDASVEVLITSHRPKAYEVGEFNDASDNVLQASMIISAWTADEATYYTLSFTSTQASAPTTTEPVRPSKRLVTRSATSRPLDSSSSSSSGQRSAGGTGTTSSKGSTVSSPMIHTPSFPPMGPPSANINSGSRSLYQKATRLKDAILNSVNMPAYAMWKDETFGIPNKALLALHPNDASLTAGNQRDWLSQYEVWDENFEQQLDVDDFPIIELCKTQQRVEGRRLGMRQPKTKARIVFDVTGEPIYDDNTGEFLGGIVLFKDVTEYTKRIAQQIEENEKQFEYIANLIPIMVWRTTPQGEHDWYSQRWYDYTGLSEADSFGEGWVHAFHPDDMPVTEERWLRSLATGEEYITEYRCKRADGQWRWMLGRAVPFLDDRGKIVKWFGTCTDIHELVEARQAARDMREQLQRVMEHAQVSLWTLNKQRIVTLFEGSMMSATAPAGGFASPVGRHIKDIVAADEWKPPVDRILSGRSKEEFVESHFEANDRWYRTRLLPLLSSDRNSGIEGEAYIDGIILVSVDSTELRRREHELKQQEKANQKLLANEAAAKEASKMKSQFLANMSHEIRTPIAGVIGMSELLLDTKLDDEQKEFAENVNRSANSLLTVINDILDFSKVESGRLDIEDVQFNLSVVIRDISKMSHFAAQRKNLTYESYIEPHIARDFKVMGDPGRLRQVIQNLLTNSLKFTSQGTISLSVRTIADKGDCTEIQFEVKDTGIGIEEEVRKKLFKPFSQADSSTARRFGGTGLGLTISKNLVELMHGHIELESKLGSGTTARFSLPFKKVHSNSSQDALVDLSSIPDRLQSEVSVSWNSDPDRTPPSTPPIGVKIEQPSRGEHAHHHHTSSRLPEEYLTLAPEARAKLHVLVVEDNPINQQIAIKTIKKLGFSVNAVWNGQEVLDYLLKEPGPSHPKPDVILMDVQMPIKDGYVATHTIRTQEPYRQRVRDIPIVAMTASAIQGDKEKCQKAGMDDYLAKPVRAPVLEKMLLKWTVNGRQRPLNRHESLSLESEYSLGSSAPSRAQSPPLATKASGPSGLSTTTPAPRERIASIDDFAAPTPVTVRDASSDYISANKPPTAAAKSAHSSTTTHKSPHALHTSTPHTTTHPSNAATINTQSQDATSIPFLPTTTSDTVSPTQQRLQYEEKASSLRDDKMLSAGEHLQSVSHTADVDGERGPSEAPRHRLTRENLDRHTSDQALREEARIKGAREKDGGAS